jgi:probable rRNA maturation factor
MQNAAHTSASSAQPADAETPAYSVIIQAEALAEIEIDGQRPYPLDLANLEAAATATLAACGVGEAELTLVIVDDEAMRTVNREYRGVDAPTDVLSFAAHEGNDDLTVPDDLAAELERYLGDVMLALPYSLRQAAEYGTRPDAELRLLVVHGVLHLLGYDHDTPTAEAEMWAQQEAILAQFGDLGLSARRYSSDEAHAMDDDDAADGDGVPHP